MVAFDGLRDPKSWDLTLMFLRNRKLRNRKPRRQYELIWPLATSIICFCELIRYNLRFRRLRQLNKKILNNKLELKNEAEKFANT